jgi:glutaredoxin-like protein NrdH
LFYTGYPTGPGGALKVSLNVRILHLFLLERYPQMVIVYTLPSCVQCDSTKRVLARNEIPYEEVNLALDADAMSYVRDLGYTAAPIVVAGDDHWSGFRMDKLSTLTA